MRIYNKIVMHIATGEVLEEDSFEYEGLIAECKGGGGGSTTTVDPVYNARMAALAEKNQVYADEMYHMFKYGVPYDPYADSGERRETGKMIENPEWEEWSKKDQAYRARSTTSDPYAGAGQAAYPPGPEPSKTIPEYANITNAEEFAWDPENTVSEMQLMQKEIEAEYKLLPQKTEVAGLGLTLQSEQLKAATELLPQQKQVASAFYEDALSGVNVEERVSQARAGVEQDFSRIEERGKRGMSRMGVDPTSGKGLSAFADLEISRATALAGAGTAAKTQAEAESFERKRSAVGMGIGTQ